MNTFFLIITYISLATSGLIVGLRLIRGGAPKKLSTLNYAHTVHSETVTVSCGDLSDRANLLVKRARLLHAEAYTWTTRDDLIPLRQQPGRLEVACWIGDKVLNTVLERGEKKEDWPWIGSDDGFMRMRYVKAGRETCPVVIHSVWEIEEAE